MVTRVPLAAVVQPETPGPRGMVELLSATTCCPQAKQERTPEPRRNRNNDREPSLGGVGMRNATGASPGRNDQGSQRHGEGSHGSEPAPEGRGESKAEARSRIDPLAGPARIWLSDLEKNSIFAGLTEDRFEKHFRGTYKRHLTSDLQACIQKKEESSRHFLTRWLACRNECENVDHTTAMYAFIGGLQRGGLLRHKLTCLANANKLTLDEMISIASDHTAADDDASGDLAATTIPLHQQKKNRDNATDSHKRKNPGDQKSGGSEMVAMAFQRGGQEAEEDAAVEAERRGRRHGTEVTVADPRPANLRDTSEQHRPRGKGGKGKNKDKEEDSSEAMDEDDNSPDPKAGSAGEFPRQHHTSRGFGDVHNFREEKITFEVVPFKSSYHVIFGRPTYHKFHARACYIYNKLKIPGPKGRTTKWGIELSAFDINYKARTAVKSQVLADFIADWTKLRI
ncbi:hypothetical protein QYE76_046627 [Lolium multiflorum]|uniref:Retrotransposon gag domain-containing protein n=1 Tax=Lolium multiflorum TaxID=4521 RepID=A0AAD8TME0_LOLMU|nr:hypothetical protein QYE76_046627 [Lolium multiflorum]